MIFEEILILSILKKHIFVDLAQSVHINCNSPQTVLKPTWRLMLIQNTYMRDLFTIPEGRKCIIVECLDYQIPIT